LIENRVLYYFLTVAETKSFASAARKLGLNASTLIRQIQKLEKELNVTLFIRTKKAVLLTDDGNRLMPYALRTTCINSDIRNEFFPDPSGLRGIVCVGLSDPLSFVSVMDIICSFRIRYPGINLELNDLPEEDLKGDLDRSELPFAVISEPMTDIRRYTVIREMKECSWGALIPPDLPMIKKNYIVPDDLAGLPLILPARPEQKNRINDWLSASGKPGSYIVSSDIHKMVPLVRKGLGIGFIPMDYSGEFSDVCVRLLFPPVKSSPKILMRKGYLTSTEYSFKDHITSYSITF